MIEVSLLWIALCGTRIFGSVGLEASRGVKLWCSTCCFPRLQVYCSSSSSYYSSSCCYYHYYHHHQHHRHHHRFSQPPKHRARRPRFRVVWGVGLDVVLVEASAGLEHLTMTRQNPPSSPCLRLDCSLLGLHSRREGLLCLILRSLQSLGTRSQPLPNRQKTTAKSIRSLQPPPPSHAIPTDSHRPRAGTSLQRNVVRTDSY